MTESDKVGIIKEGLYNSIDRLRFEYDVGSVLIRGIMGDIISELRDDDFDEHDIFTDDDVDTDDLEGFFYNEFEDEDNDNGMEDLGV